MARKRKTETKVPMKPPTKSSVRKSTRQKAKKQQLEDEKVNGTGDASCENTKNTDNSLTDSDVDDKNGQISPSKLQLSAKCVNEVIFGTSIENDTDKSDYETFVNAASLVNSLNDDDVIEETTIYEEMEIETEPTIDCSITPDNNTNEQTSLNTLECAETESKINNVNSECANSNSYLMIEQGLSGLHMSELENAKVEQLASTLTKSKKREKNSDGDDDDCLDLESKKKPVESQCAVGKKESEDVKNIVTTEEHSINSETNNRMDIVECSSGESSSDTVLSRTKNDSSEQCENNEKTEPSVNSGVRRSNRIKHIGLKKQRSRGRGLVVKPMQELERDKLKNNVELAETPIAKLETQLDKTVPQDSFTPVSISATNCDSNKPVKVKSRWRRSSELEMSNQSNGTDTGNSINKELNCNIDLNATTNPIKSEFPSSNISSGLAVIPEVDREMEERLSQFEHLRENLYLTERYTNKETKRMVCDCFLTEDEIERGELGCGEDCLNRLLMIECGSRCVVSDRCTNRRFQNCNYAKCEVFRTEKKGFGLRATSNLNAGDFIMEYVGEVVDSRNFRRRAKEYSKDKNRHYYFMALKSDQIIDATLKGNISRFINHSCDPNAETQKWTVNGELRIGFFNKKFVAAGEEITFDYHFQRYGKEAQKCFCEAFNCRGWIGDNPEDGKANVELDDDFDSEDDSDSEEDQQQEPQQQQQQKQRQGDGEPKPRKPARRSKREEKKIVDHMEDEDLEEQIDRLCASGLKNRAHTLTLSRLMVRCRELQHRSRLLKVIQSGDQPCRRLFLDYHGLRLMWSYMMDVAGSDTEEARQFRLEIVKTLTTLPIPNRTMLIDSKVLGVIEKWSKQLYHSSPPSGDSPDGCEEAQDKEDDDKEKDKDKIEVKNEQSAVISELAANLLENWTNLKEVFRIPKKERLEQMKEHERDADRGYKEADAEREAPESLSYAERSKQADTIGIKRRGRESPAEFKDKRGVASAINEDRPNLVQVPRMSKFERRHLFALKVAKEEEERLRRQQEELWQQHQAQCLALGVDPYSTAALDPQSGYPLLFDPQLAQWQVYPSVPSAYPTDPTIYQQPQLNFVQQQPPPQMTPLQNDCNEQLEVTVDTEQAPPPALDLPPKWKWARDKRGRLYFYHIKERVPQWLPPPPDHIGMQPDSEPDSSSDDEEEDEPSAEDDEEEEAVDDDADDNEDEAETVSPRENDEDEVVDAAVVSVATEGVVAVPDDHCQDEEQAHLAISIDVPIETEQPPQPVPVKHSETSRKRRDGLVQERIISPRREEDRIDHSKFKELKEKLRRQKEKSKLKEHHQLRKHRRSAKLKQTQAKSFQTIATHEMSPTTERKIKDTFRINMAHVMVHFLNPYRKNDCKQGRITNTEDFKYLARKLTHFVLAKELKHCKSVDELECNENVKHKAKDFVRKYMNKFGPVYQRDKDED